MYDEQPTTFQQSWTQRMRWSKGFYQVAARYIGGLFRGCFTQKKGRFACYDMMMTVAPGMLLTMGVLGINIFIFLSALTAWMADPARLQKLRWLMAALAIGLLSVTLVLGRSKFGAANWIILGPFSFQPSEIEKIFYIFAGSATLERLFRRRNLGLFMVLTGVCLLCLALMSDFGTA